MRGALGEALIRAGFDAEEAADATEAMDLLAHGRFDVVIADYRLPGMTGLEVLAALRGAYPQAPLILYSAWMTPELAAQARTSGSPRCWRSRSHRIASSKRCRLPWGAGAEPHEARVSAEVAGELTAGGGARRRSRAAAPGGARPPRGARVGPDALTRRLAVARP